MQGPLKRAPGIMDTADIFVTQLLMIRYNELLNRIKTLYNVPEERIAILKERIINAQWLQQRGDIDCIPPF